MNSRLWGGRRAEAFQNAVDGHVEPTNCELAELVHLACGVREMPAVSLSTDSKAAMRARLVAEADAMLIPPTRTSSKPAPKRRGLRIAAGSAVVVTAMSGGLVSVSANALPGDALYPIKRGFENFELSLPGGANTTGQTQLQQASNRLEEAEALARQGNADQIDGALYDFADAADAGADQLMRVYAENGDAGSIVTIRAFTNAAGNRLHTLSSLIDESVMPSYTAAVSTVTAIDKRAVEACPECTTAPLVDVSAASEPDGDEPITLPRFDLRFGEEVGEDPNQQLAEPVYIPHKTDLPDNDDAPGPESEDAPGPDFDVDPESGDPDDNGPDNKGPDDKGPDNKGPDDKGGPRLDSDTRTDRDSGTYRDPENDGPKNDTDRGDDGKTLPGLSDLSPDLGEAHTLPGVPELDKALDPLRDILGPVRDLLGPVLGDHDDEAQDPDANEDKGPLSGLLSPLLDQPEDETGDQATEPSEDEQEGPLGGLLDNGDDEEAPAPDSDDQATPPDSDDESTQDPTPGDDTQDETDEPVDPLNDSDNESGTLDDLDSLNDSDDDSATDQGDDSSDGPTDDESDEPTDTPSPIIR